MIRLQRKAGYRQFQNIVSGVSASFEIRAGAVSTSTITEMYNINGNSADERIIRIDNFVHCPEKVINSGCTTAGVARHEKQNLQ